ncbi:MAG: recombinase family protein [Labrys sp. (in: a-proteobacteria)]
MACFIYIRVSTDRQASEGESLGNQERTARGYAQMLGLEVTQVFTDAGVSGSTPLADRPAGGGLLAVLKPGDTVITPKLDRMFRSSLDALANLRAMKETGVSLHMIDLGGDVTGNGIAKLVFTILSAVAENERDRIRERIKTVKADQRQRSRYLGGSVPFGYRLEGEALVEDAAQMQAVKQMRTMRADGASFRAIAETVSLEGFTLSHEAIRKILKRKAD